jgi:hypothetical protein
VSTRGLVRIAQWRGRRQAQADLARSNGQVFRGLIQINLIRPH